jgi:diguanylate cyclase (GGDEF)-like protein
VNALNLINTETLRIADLQQQDLINTPLDARFNRLARLTRAALQAKAASISLLLRDREWFKAIVGWNVGELPIERSLVAALGQSTAPLVVHDLRTDRRFREHPLVIREPGVRFLAAHPLIDRFKHRIGYLAAYDMQPHDATGEALETLVDLGNLAQRELLLGEIGNAQQQLIAKLDASRRQSLLDELTHLWNRRGGLQLLEEVLADDDRKRPTFGVCVADVDSFKSINDQYGHSIGDAVLRKVASTLVDNVRSHDVVCRLGGDEFLVIFPAIEPDDLEPIMQRLREYVERLVIRVGSTTVRVALSIGGCLNTPGSGLSAEDVIKSADGALYRAKRGGRNQAILADGVDDWRA